MSIDHQGHTYEFEPQYGLPERLPSDEHVVWQGSPQVWALAISAFHIRKMMLYFAALVMACAWPALESGAGAMAVLQGIKWIAPLTAIGLLSVGALAWFTAKTTVYTVTNKRVVMRLGIVLTVTFNLPLKQIHAADVCIRAGGSGDIHLALKGSDRIAWVHLWPSVRAWRITRPEPTLRAIADVDRVSAKLRAAWTAETGLQANTRAQEPSEHRVVHLQGSLT